MKAKILDGKTAIVFGSTSGIGEATCKVFAREGAKVIVTGRREEKGAKVVDAIKAAGGTAMYVKADVSKPEDIKNAIDQMIKAYGRIDILVNNAAIEHTKLFKDCTIDDYNRVMETNMRSYYLGCMYALPYMLKQKAGNIININSVTTRKPVPGLCLYAMAKTGISSLTKVLAMETAKDGIRVNQICHGLINTEIFLDPVAMKVAQGGVVEIPLGRMGTSEEIANTCLFLASDDSSYLTGSDIFVDGGMSTR